MDAIEMLKRDLALETTGQRAIIDSADAEGRALSDTERDAAEKAPERIHGLKSRIADETEKNKLRDLVDGFTREINGQRDPNPVKSDNPEITIKARTIGDALVQSDSFRHWQGVMKDTGSAPRFTVPSVFVPTMKAAGDPVLESDNANVFAGGPGPLTTFAGLEQTGFVQFRPTIEDLLSTVPITVGNSVTYPIVKTRTQISSTPQTEGSAKPGGEYEFDMVTKVLLTMAGYVKLSTQFIEDAPSLVAYINSDLPLQIRQNVETYLADALYDAAQFSGGAGLFSGTEVDGDNRYDAILAAITAIQENGGNPNGMVISPTDWATALASKTTGDGNYIGGGPFAATGNPWGLRVIVTPSAVTGEALVGDFSRGAKIYARGGYNVDSTNTDQDDFIKNKFTVRAERRLVVGVTYPEFFGVAQVGNS